MTSSSSCAFYRVSHGSSTFHAACVGAHIKHRHIVSRKELKLGKPAGLATQQLLLTLKVQGRCHVAFRRKPSRHSFFSDTIQTLPATSQPHVTGPVSVRVVEFPLCDLETANLTETEHMSSF